MSNKLYLISEDGEIEDILLYKSCNNLESNVIDKIVYQDQKYKVCIETQIEDVKEITLLMNNKKCMFGNYKKTVNNNTIKFTFDSLDGYSNGFALIFGSVKFTIVFIMNDNSEYILFSNNIGIAIKGSNAYLENSVEMMLREILEKENNLLYKKGIRKNYDSLQNNYDERINLEIELIDNVLLAYHMNFPYFMRDIKYKMTESRKIDRFEKLKSINSNTINYIVTHTEELEQVNYFTGISFYNHNVQPKKTLISIRKENDDIYENRVVIGFLQYLVEYLNNKQIEIKNLLSVITKGIKMEKFVKKGYQLSDKIIKLFTQRELDYYLKEIKNRQEKINMMMMQYKNIIDCESNRIEGQPSNTPIFQNIIHYRNIFISICKWFQIGKYDLNNEKKILNFVTADQIYEYYCLLRLFSSLTELGYEEIKERRNIYHYNVPEKYYGRADDENTFYFRRGNETLVLYSQPVVYSSKDSKNNGISLFRTDQHFYTPDFIIKHINNKNELNYFILDAKWRQRKNVEYEKMVYKYMVGIADDNEKQGKKFMWILQGKDDGKKELCNLNRGEISRSKSQDFIYQTGVLKLIPEINNQKLSFLLDVFLNDEE